jgi:hypothetical protein
MLTGAPNATDNNRMIARGKVVCAFPLSMTETAGGFLACEGFQI